MKNTVFTVKVIEPKNKRRKVVDKFWSNTWAGMMKQINDRRDRFKKMGKVRLELNLVDVWDVAKISEDQPRRAVP